MSPGISFSAMPGPAKADDVSLALPRGSQNGACPPLLAPVTKNAFELETPDS